MNQPIQCQQIVLLIPFVKMLIKTLEKHHNDSGVKTMKKMLLSVKCRFSNIESNVPLVIACLLNPRFKDRFLSGSYNSTG